MQHIYIFGNSGFAAEVAQLILSTGNYVLKGFIEKDDVLCSCSCSCKIVNGHKINIITEKVFQNIISSSKEKIQCVIAIAKADICINIYDRFREYCDFPNIVSPDAMLNDSLINGIGNIFFQGCWISWNVQIGSFNKFLPFVTIGHETIIGNHNEFNPKVSISGKTKIGNGNLFGMNSMLYQGKKVGDNNVIGMGSGIIKNISDNSTLFGNPAKYIYINE